jgi:hypothetical protein
MNPANNSQPQEDTRPPEEIMFTQFQALDPQRKGVGLHQLRVFYPGIGWNVILKHLKVLEEAGRMTSVPQYNSKGGVSHKLYTWKSS